MKEFIEMSKYAGMREDLVQAGGGNSSYKMAPDRMLVKASGFQLADVKEDAGYAIVNPKIIADAFMQNADIDKMTEVDSRRILQEAYIEGARPSIETFLHVVSGRYTLHTHPIVVNVLTSRAGGMEVLKELLPDALAVPYATPGAELAKTYFKQCREYGRQIRVVFLQNHGLLVSADTAEEVMEVTEDVLQKLEQYLQVDFSGYHTVTKLYRFLGQGIIWRVTDQNILEAYSRLGSVWEHVFCPDCVVFLGKKMYEPDGLDALERSRLEKFRKIYGEPVVISYQGGLYIQAESVKKALEIQSVLSFSSQVMALNQGYACNMLPDAEQDFLLGWDAEKYRKEMK